MAKKKTVFISTLLFSLLFAIIAGLTAIYQFRAVTSGSKAVTDIKIDSSADLALNSMHQTSTRNGIKEWTLEASSARLMKEKNRAFMEDVNVTFYTKNRDKLLLTSQQGELDTQNHDMTFTGNVVVTFQGNTLETDKLHYEKKRHIIYSNSRVLIRNRHSTIHGDSLVADLDKNSTTIRGNVKGRFSEDFFLF